MTNWKDDEHPKDKPAKDKGKKTTEKGAKEPWKKVQTIQNCVSKIKHAKDSHQTKDSHRTKHGHHAKDMHRSASMLGAKQKQPHGPAQRRFSSADQNCVPLKNKGVTILIRARQKNVDNTSNTATQGEENVPITTIQDVENDDLEEKPEVPSQRQQPSKVLTKRKSLVDILKEKVSKTIM